MRILCRFVWVFGFSITLIAQSSVSPDLYSKRFAIGLKKLNELELCQEGIVVPSDRWWKKNAELVLSVAGATAVWGHALGAVEKPISRAQLLGVGAFWAVTGAGFGFGSKWGKKQKLRDLFQQRQRSADAIMKFFASSPSPQEKTALLTTLASNPDTNFELLWAPLRCKEDL